MIMKPSSTHRVIGVFLRFMAAIYLSAFSSFYLQIRGLYGHDGVLPCHARLNLLDKRNFLEKYWENPTLLHLSVFFELPVSYCLEFFTLTGIVLSFFGLVYQSMCNFLTFLTLWIIYLSSYQVGQTFLYFQWDTLLLESGLLTVLVAPFIHSNKATHHPKEKLCFWLIKWLLFRLMFASGVVKLTSKCPTWWSLSALTIHFESQCIPTQLAWYFHQLPVWFHKLSVVATYIIEIALPFFFFAPFRKLHLISFYGQALLQVLIIVTGNYNFFNFLTLCLCFSLVDDQHLFAQPQHEKRLKTSTSENVITLASIGIVIYWTCQWFSIEFGTEDFINSETRFTFQEYEAALKIAVPASIVIGTACFVITVLASLYDLVFKSKSSLVVYVIKVIKFVPYLVAATFLFGISLVTFSTLDRPTQTALPTFLNRWHGQLNQFHLTSSYGLFRSMTGVGGRPELVLEGASKLEGPWTEIPFKYKPGAVDRPCPFVVPHQPRLDWQMWFAALGTYHQHPWLISLVYRLLTNQTEVINLLDSSIYNEFDEDWPPNFIKGSLYTYHYTSLNDSIRSDWWKRTRISDYLPIISANHQPLIDYLVKQKILNQPNIQPKNAVLMSVLDNIWNFCTAMEPHLFVWALLFSALTIALHHKKRCFSGE